MLLWPGTFRGSTWNLNNVWVRGDRGGAAVELVGVGRRGSSVVVAEDGEVHALKVGSQYMSPTLKVGSPNKACSLSSMAILAPNALLLFWTVRWMRTHCLSSGRGKSALLLTFASICSRERLNNLYSSNQKLAVRLGNLAVHASTWEGAVHVSCASNRIFTEIDGCDVRVGRASGMFSGVGASAVSAPTTVEDLIGDGVGEGVRVLRGVCRIADTLVHGSAGAGIVLGAGHVGTVLEAGCPDPRVPGQFVTGAFVRLCVCLFALLIDR